MRGERTLRCRCRCRCRCRRSSRTLLRVLLPSPIRPNGTDVLAQPPPEQEATWFRPKRRQSSSALLRGGLDLVGSEWVLARRRRTLVPIRS